MGGELEGQSHWAERKEILERTSLLTISLALSLAVLGAAELAGTNGVLAAFVAGVAFNAVTTNDAREGQEKIQEAITRFFVLPIFVLLAAAVLFLRRPPAVLALEPLPGSLGSTKDLLFLGWFGHVGAATFYYATYASRETGIEEVWTVSSLIVCASPC
jgi:NhaP-type Na+/H+ or K+/H+ antiporter